MINKLYKENGKFSFDINGVDVKTILVVDDQANVRTLIKDYLTKEGFRVITAENGQKALYLARQEKPDMILLDVMMPVMDGLEFMRIYQKEQDTPIILLTAKVEETDVVLGLEIGADDYITKPFRMREMLARIRAILRRSDRTHPGSEILKAADIILDKGTRQVTVKGIEVHLTPSEFELLAILITSPGRVFSRAYLLEQVQGTAFESIERNIDVHIRNLRTKIEEDAGSPRYIETVFGVGYRFCKEVNKEE